MQTRFVREVQRLWPIRFSGDDSAEAIPGKDLGDGSASDQPLRCWAMLPSLDRLGEGDRVTRVR